ncbi:MAG: hypothetical protein AAF998_19285 [Bacteroidota bacterium]
MRPMIFPPNRHFFAVAFVLLCYVSTAISSCDACRSVDCVNGSCDRGDCICTAGYEGAVCDIPVNAKFVGTFTTEEACTAGSDDYEIQVQVIEGSNTGLRFIGLWDQPRDTIEVQIADDGFSFTITRQAYAGKEIEGAGEIGSSLESGNLNYRVYEPGAANAFDTCNLTYQ